MKGILLDIEGTTTPITFVYEVLFPYARAHVSEHLGKDDIRALRLEHKQDVRNGFSPPEWSGQPVDYVHWLMDQDRKSTPLKNLQGKIWLDGYKNGELHGEVYADVPRALARWKEQGIDVRIYSSGSVLAQQLLFSSTKDGDLTSLLSGHFDTTTGAKTELESYLSIAQAFGLQASEILFISDVTRELDAARSARMQTALCIRPGNHPQLPGTHRTILSFDEID
ncbi:MAG TPA: acireductone synthase [Terriglobia bacterium]|nr:acireductone synthase [Terriglobia bacterium]